MIAAQQSAGKTLEAMRVCVCFAKFTLGKIATAEA
jgi:hypothetical protein